MHWTLFLTVILRTTTLDMLVRAGVSEVTNTLGIIERTALVALWNLAGAWLAGCSGHRGHRHTWHLREAHTLHSLHGHHCCHGIVWIK